MVVSLGVEVEFFSIYNNRITSRVIKPHKRLRERGERFAKDGSVGTEYNSKVFYNVNEAYFLLRAGLRKFVSKNYAGTKSKLQGVGLFGGWDERAAGTHIHLGCGSEDMTKRQALSLSRHIHSHLPFLIAICASSPIWEERLQRFSSSRIHHKGKDYCAAVKYGELTEKRDVEMTFNRYKGKPSTLEIRICDSNIPEYIAAAVFVVYVLGQAWQAGKRPANRNSIENYSLGRRNAITHGPESYLYWNNRQLAVPEYIDKFFRVYKKEISRVEAPEIENVFNYLRQGYNHSVILRKACKNIRKQTRSWKRRFIIDYVAASNALLDGGSLRQYANALHVKLPPKD